MMMLWLLLSAQAAVPPRAPTSTAARSVELAPPAPPANWVALPDLRYRRRPDPGIDLAGYVRDEVRAGRCIATRTPDGSLSVEVEMAVLVSGAGPVRRIVPRAINCPTVEQYASGVVERLARDNVDPTGAETDAWYRTALDFAWRE